MADFLTEDQARQLVETYLVNEQPAAATQEILDSGLVKRLSGYRVKPGKVSDSIVGGTVQYLDKQTGNQVTIENPPLNAKTGVPLRIMVRTERISTHDINRGAIPFKDQILAANHNYMRRLLTEALGTSQFDLPELEDTAVVVAAENLQQIPIEMVLRAYLAKSTTSTSLYQAYAVRKERIFAGHLLPEGLMVNGPLPYIMDTPSTKSEAHDETIDPQYLFDHQICRPQQYAQIRNAAIFAFGLASNFLRQRGIIAVDTKTEHGLNHLGQIVSQDEIWTMDSSRFWLRDDYEQQMKKYLTGEIAEINPLSYSKEFARGFSEGEKGYTDEQRAAIAVRYIMGMQHLLEKPFEPDQRPRTERVIVGLEAAARLAG